MKKGLAFALLMVALVAIAVPASAMAPIIKDLPAVIIGDSGDVSADGTMAVLFRYTNVFNMANSGVIESVNTPGDNSHLRVYYTTDSSTLKASNATAIVPQITAGELATLQSDGTIPTAKVINTSTDLWLSLIQDSPGAGKTSATSAASATFDANGASTAELIAAGVIGGTAVAPAAVAPSVVTLYATDEDAATTKVSDPGSFVVYTIPGVDDSYSQTAIPVKTFSFEGSNEGWVYVSNSGAVDGYSAVSQASSSTGVGFNATSGSAGYSSWQSISASDNTNLVPAAGMDGQVFRARLTLSGNAASSDAAPGYRFLYLSQGFMHEGGFQVLTPASGAGTTAVNAPSTGSDVDVRAYWAVPTTMTEYSDSGAANGGIVTGLDMRDYYFSFDIVKGDATDAGTLILENLAIESIVRPSDVTPTVRWGSQTGDVAFNAAAGDGGWFASSGTIAGIGTGTATVNAGNVSLNMGTADSGYKQVSPTSQASVYPSWASDVLYRVKYSLSCATPNNFAATRFFLLGYEPNTSNLMPVLWADVLDTSIRGYYAPGNLAGAPAAAGSTLETYYYGQNAGTENALLVPAFDVAQTANWDVNGWTRPSANVVISSCSIEELAD